MKNEEKLKVSKTSHERGERYDRENIVLDKKSVAFTPLLVSEF